MEEKQEKSTQDAYYYRLAFRIAADFGVILAVPAVLGAFLGKWLDNKWGTTPWIFILCLVVAFVLTAFYIVRKAKIYGRLYQNGPEN